jgi:hypothetical protein
MCTHAVGAARIELDSDLRLHVYVRDRHVGSTPWVGESSSRTTDQRSEFGILQAFIPEWNIDEYALDGELITMIIVTYYGEYVHEPGLTFPDNPFDPVRFKRIFCVNALMIARLPASGPSEFVLSAWAVACDAPPGTEIIPYSAEARLHPESEM